MVASGFSWPKGTFGPNTSRRFIDLSFFPANRFQGIYIKDKCQLPSSARGENWTDLGGAVHRNEAKRSAISEHLFKHGAKLLGLDTEILSLCTLGFFPFIHADREIHFWEGQEDGQFLCAFEGSWPCSSLVSRLSSFPVSRPQVTGYTRLQARFKTTHLLTMFTKLNKVRRWHKDTVQLSAG